MDKKKITVLAFILMTLTSVFGVANIGTGFYRMGYAAIPLFLLGGILYFIPFLIMMVEFATGFNDKEGGIYTWMEKSVSLKYAFIGIMMWYSSYVIWMFSKALSVWIPLSFLLFGTDVTTSAQTVSFLGNTTQIGPISPFMLGVFGAILVLVITLIIANGASFLSKIASIGGIAVIAMNFILIVGGFIALAMNGFALQEPLTVASLTTSPNPEYQSLFPFLGFVVFAVFAYGGTEAIAGVSQDLKNPKRDTKKAILISGAFIIICYIVGFLMVGSAMKWSDFGEANSLSAIYIIMENLGNTLAPGTGLGEFFVRFAGLGMFLSYIGAFISLAYAPLKQLIEGTPKYFWPSSFEKVNKNGIRVSALWCQSIIVLIFIAIKSILSLASPDGADALFELIISMTNVGMTIPYLFLIYAWYRYRQNDSLKKGIIMIKSKTIITILFAVSMIAVIFGNVFTIISPFVSGDITTGIWTIIGPIFFASIAIIIYYVHSDN